MLLDCTLRDGGFVNDWEFGYSSIRNIVSRLDSAGIEIVEVGFIDARREYDKNRSIFPDATSIGQTLHDISVRQAMLVGMIDFGTCPIENVVPYDKNILDGIRVIFKKQDSDAALDFCSKLKENGYHVFVNPVSLTSYKDREILDLLEKINAIEPFAVSIVDTYGLMLRDEILHYVNLVDKNLASGIFLGYHSHNNQQMAYANCCTLLDHRNRHNIIVDASLFGIGKSAGNANTELVASYANKVHAGKYKTEQLLDCIYTDIMKIYKKTPWGYNLHYYLSALNDCHPNYIEFLLGKNTLSVQGIDEIVAKIPQEQKLTYSQTLIDKLYIEYQSVAINDTEVYGKLENFSTNNNILLVFPGSTILTHEADVNKYIENNNPVIISVNFIPQHIITNYVFTGNRKRYDKLSDSYFRTEKKPCVIATSNILESNVPITYRLNYESLITSEHNIADNSAVLCLNFLKKLGIKQVAIAGMDGFSKNIEKNYADPFMEMYSVGDNLLRSNLEMEKFVSFIRTDMELNFITPSYF